MKHDATMSVPLCEPRRPIFYRVPKDVRARWLADEAMIKPLVFFVSPTQ